MFKNKNVSQIMKKKVVTVAPTISIWHATNKMRTGKVGCVVVAEDNKVLGVFSERDVVSKVLSRKLNVDSTPVSEVMTSPVVTVSESTLLNDVLYITCTRHIRHLPVITPDGSLVGMVSIRDLLYLLVNELLEDDYLQIKKEA